jgi:hypothetical protein
MDAILEADRAAVPPEDGSALRRMLPPVAKGDETEQAAEVVAAGALSALS